MKDLILKIKSKKPLDRLDDSIVEEFVNKFFNRNPKIKKKYFDSKIKKKDFEIIFKNVRNELNKIYGQFWLSDRLDLYSHKSTKERINFYSKLYKDIFRITGKPKTLLDLGCGLNYLTYELIGKDVYFIVTELTDYDCEIIKDYFKKTGIKGEVLKSDLRDFTDFPKADICFMFKLLDVLENNEHKLAEKLVKTIDVKYIVVSFSTKNTRGRKMNYPKRGWFELMIKRLGYSFSKLEYENEIFYVVKK